MNDLCLQFKDLALGDLLAGEILPGLTALSQRFPVENGRGGG